MNIKAQTCVIVCNDVCSLRWCCVCCRVCDQKKKGASVEDVYLVIVDVCLDFFGCQMVSVHGL